MKKYLLFLCAILVHSLAIAQDPLMDLMKGMKPRFIGPAGMSGRVTSIDVNKKNLDHIIIGTASGGVWESKNGGISFSPIFDKAPIQSIGSVAFDPTNPTIIWAGTGEGNPRNSQSSGIGIFKSIDGGKTWNLAGLPKSKTIHRIIIDPNNSNVVYVASLGSAWGPNSQRGVFKTIDGGQNWDQILFVNDTVGCADLIMDPSNPNKLIAAMWQYERKPWTFTSGGNGSGIYITYDGGGTWKKQTEKEGLPTGKIGRSGLAFATNKPEVVYALIESKKTGLYKSTDGGEKWKLVSTKNIGNRPFYYADIFVDPTNENRLFNLYSVISMSEDGGKTFKQIAPYTKVHPDHHAFWIEPTQGKFIIDGNDGGLLISRDGGKNWQSISNLPLGQFYHINIDQQIPYNIYGGLQDNGSWVGPAYVYENGGIRNHHWDEVLFGDGFDVMSNSSDPNKIFAMYQGGGLFEIDILKGHSSFIQPSSEDSIPLRYSWNAPLAKDPFNPNGIYFGSQFLHYSKNGGKQWEIISLDLTTNDTSKQKQSISGGLTIDATRAENHTTLLSIAPSSIDSNLILVGTDDGNLQLTKNKGETWVNLTSKLPNAPKNAWIPQIICSEHNAGEAYVVINNYRQNDWRPYLYKTTNFGKTWVSIVDDNIKGYCLSIIQDPINPNLLFSGTQRGLYVSLDGGKKWNKWNTEIPSVPIRDMKIHPVEHDLILGTFGRSIIILDDVSPLRTLAEKGRNILNDSLLLFSNRTAYHTPWKSAKGIRFAGDSEFKGMNRNSNYSIRIWVSPGLYKKAKKEKTKAKASVYVLNHTNDTLSYNRIKLDSLINSPIPVSLFENNTPLYLRRNKPKDANKKEIFSKGKPLLPGNYTILVKLDSVIAKHEFEVREHPTNGKPLAYRVEQHKAFDGVDSIMKPILEDINRLQEMEEIVENIKKATHLMNNSEKDTLEKYLKTVTDTIGLLFEMYFSPKDFVGYDHVSVRISDHNNRVQSFLNAENMGESNLLEIAKKNLLNAWKKAHKAQISFEEGQWKALQNRVNESPINFFRNLE